MSTAKPFAISKRMVWNAYQAVKVKGGAPGADDQSLEMFVGSSRTIFIGFGIDWRLVRTCLHL
jgi:hypothetical protein